MELVKIPTRLMPEIVNLLSAEFQKLAEQKANSDKKLSETQYALERETNKRKALEEHAAELERQLGADDDF